MSLELNILLIEDDEDDFVIISELLEDVEGYAFSVQWETSHTTGLSRLQDEQFDICLVDYRIGAKTGIDFIADAKELNTDVPMILVTGVPDRDVDLEASLAGAVDFFEKAALTSFSLERAIRYSIARVGQSKLHGIKTQMQRSDLEQEIRQAIAGHQFEVYLQPVVQCETMQIKKVEALVRWNHPSRGVLGPYHFIDVAEQTELIIGIGNCVIEQVCQISNRLNTSGDGLKVAFNVSVAQIERPDFADIISRALAIHQTDPSTIEIEITESVAMREPRQVRSHMDTLKRMGIRFAVDDFGTGHSGLATLKDFPFDVIKIDRAFVQTAEHSARHRAIAKTIFYLADVMRLETVAEGIETDEQFAFVKNYGATYAQGYLFSKPLCYDDLQEFARRFDIELQSKRIRTAI